MFDRAMAIGRDLRALGDGLLRKARLVPRPTGRDLLFVDDAVPDPALGAGYPRSFEMVKLLVEDGWQVTMYPLYGRRGAARRVAAMLPDVRFMPSEGARGLRRLLRTRSGEFAALIVSRPHVMAVYAAAAEGLSSGPPVIYDAEALLASREARRRRFQGTPWTAEEYEKAVADEIALARHANAVIAVTPAEAATFRARLGVPVVVASHSLPVAASPTSFDERSDLLFVGRLAGDSATSPNVDSIMWFVREVLPELDRLLGSRLRLHLVGKVESAEIAALDGDRVTIHGLVDDIAPFFDRMRVVIAPTRFSAGLPLKVVEAMTRGVPCATTPLLKHQLGRADDGEATLALFAEEVRRLYTDPDAWRDEREAGLRLVQDSFSPAAFRTAIREVLRAVTNPSGAGRGQPVDPDKAFR